MRVRKPAKVIEEMQQLRKEHGVRVFLFQDDDFPLWGNPGRRWAIEMIDRFHDSGLADDTVWKISCRGEYVDADLFTRLRDAGLFLVYMGIESGVEDGLEVLNKEMTVEGNLRAVRTLKDLGILFSYGFMLFDPSSTFESVRQNVGFLREITGDGSAAATFCRMLPYGGTPIRDQLAKEGRLRGDLTHPDYVFNDLRLNEYHRLLSQTARAWIHNEGLSHHLNYAWDELETIARLVQGIKGADAYRSSLRTLTAESNEKLFQLVEISSEAFEHDDRSPLNEAAAKRYCDDAAARLFALRRNFLSDNVYLLMEAVHTTTTSDGPVMAPQIH